MVIYFPQTILMNSLRVCIHVPVLTNKKFPFPRELQLNSENKLLFRKCWGFINV